MVDFQTHDTKENGWHDTLHVTWEFDRGLVTGQLMKKMNYLQPSKIKFKKYTVN